MNNSFQDDDAELQRALSALKKPTSPEADFSERVISELRARHLVRHTHWSSIAWKIAASVLIFVSGVGAGLLISVERSPSRNTAVPVPSVSLQKPTTNSPSVNLPSAGRAEVWY